MSYEDALILATAQSTAALALIEKLLLFMHGRDPEGMAGFLDLALQGAVPPPEHPDGETDAEAVQRLSAEAQQRVIASVARLLQPRTGQQH